MAPEATTFTEKVKRKGEGLKLALDALNDKATPQTEIDSKGSSNTLPTILINGKDSFIADEPKIDHEEADDYFLIKVI